MAQRGRLKAFSPLQQQFMLFSACQILSFFFKQGLNLPWNTAEFSCSSASGPGGTQSGKSTSLTGTTDKVGPPPLSLYGDNWCRRREEEPYTDDLTPRANADLSLQTIMSHVTGTGFGKDEVLAGWATLQTSSQRRPSAGPCNRRHFTSNFTFSYSCLKRQHTSLYTLRPPHQWASISPWKWAKSHYLIGKNIWHAATREQQQKQLKRLLSLGALQCHNLNALVAYNIHSAGTAFKMRLKSSTLLHVDIISGYFCDNNLYQYDILCYMCE